MEQPPVKAVFNWSGGKDSALALYKVLQEGEYNVIALVTTVNSEEKRSTMHGIPVTLLQKQADSIGIPLHIIDIAPKGGMLRYEEAMSQCVSRFKALGVTHFIFGDIFLHDVKTYREEKLTPYGITVVEPLWGKTSAEIIEEFLASGLQTIIVTTTADILDGSYIGKTIDRHFIDTLPAGIDPCGENGEYHTFCHAGPLFKTPIPYSLGTPRQATYPVNLDDGTTKHYTYWFATLTDPA